MVCLSAGIAAAQKGEAKRQPDPAQRFARADKNGDGQLNLEEFLGKNTKNKEQRERRFKKLDGDGNGTLSKAEFEAGMKKQ